MDRWLSLLKSSTGVLSLVMAKWYTTVVPRPLRSDGPAQMVDRVLAKPPGIAARHVRPITPLAKIQ
jgi:hypothetical protein